MGRGRAPWEGQEQGRGMGHGRLFRVVGWDGQTGTHLLLSLPGVEEDTPWEQYLQVTGGNEYSEYLFSLFIFFCCIGKDLFGIRARGERWEREREGCLDALCRRRGHDVRWKLVC